MFGQRAEQQRITTGPKGGVSCAPVRAVLAAGDVSGALSAADMLGARAPLDPDVLMLRADCALAAGKAQQAAALLDRASSLVDSGEIWAAKGRALTACDQPDRAALSFGRAHALSPLTGADGTHMLQTLRRAGRPLEAMRAAASMTLDADGAVAAAEAAADCGRAETAQAWLRQALAAWPAHTGALRLIEQWAAAAIPLPDQVALAREADDATVLSARALASLARLSAPRRAAQFAERIQRRLQSQTATSQELAALHHAQFVMLERLDQPQDAYAHLMAARECHAATQTRQISVKDRMAQMEQMGQMRLTGLGRTKTHILPIFVIGLPGSGVVQTARLLGQAAGVTPARTGHMIRQIVGPEIAALPGSDPSKLPREVLFSLSAQLRTALTDIAAQNEVIVDASRGLAPLVGILCAALPEAKIVHVRRDAMQTGWAMLSADPTCEETIPVTTPGEIAALQHAETRLMSQFGSQFPSQVVDLSGDALCRPSGLSARAVVNAVGLNWTEHCMQPPYTPSRAWHRHAAALSDLRRAVQATT